MPKPLTIDEAFPSIEGLTKDAKSVSIISPAYATSKGELNAILQYFYHFFNFDKCGYDEIARTIESIAIAEMLHLEILGKMIIAMGACPVYCQNPPTAFNFYSAKYVSYSRNLKHMIEDDILAEKQAIASYKHMLCLLKNDQVKDVISRILKDECLHLEKFKEILSTINC